jgi:hypothetical protein
LSLTACTIRWRSGGTGRKSGNPEPGAEPVRPTRQYLPTLNQVEQKHCGKPAFRLQETRWSPRLQRSTRPRDEKLGWVPSAQPGGLVNHVRLFMPGLSPTWDRSQCEMPPGATAGQEPGWRLFYNRGGRGHLGSSSTPSSSSATEMELPASGAIRRRLYLAWVTAGYVDGHGRTGVRSYCSGDSSPGMRPRGGSTYRAASTVVMAVNP